MQKGDYQSLKQATDYDKRRFGKGLQLVSQDEMEVIKNFLSSCTHPETILDIGTGTGRMLEELLKAKPKVVFALDPSSTMLSILKKKYKNRIRKGVVKTIKAPSDKIPLPDKSINVTTSVHVLKHIRNITPTIREVERILSPKGYFIFDILNSKSIIRFNLGTCFAITEERIYRQLETHGFTVKKVKYLHSFGETVYNIPTKFGLYLIHFLDRSLSSVKPKSGTKIFILAQKDE